MYFILILREGDIDVMKDYARQFVENSDEELVEKYNQQAKLGITGVHAQALYLCGLGHVFLKRFSWSPIKVTNNVLSIGDKVELVNGDIVPLEEEIVEKPEVVIEVENVTDSKDEVEAEIEVKKVGDVTFFEKERLNLVFCSLIINVSSIEERFSSLEEFILKYKIHGITNRKILVISEMSSPPHILLKYLEMIFHPLGMESGSDYVLAEEQLAYGVKYEPSIYLHKPHPQCKNINWLESEVTEEGNLVWYRSLP